MNMRNEIRRLPEETELEIGISSGDVVVGTLGHRSHRQKDIMGTAVMVAASIGHHRGIAITSQVYEKIKDDYELNVGKVIVRTLTNL